MINFLEAILISKLSYLLFSSYYKAPIRQRGCYHQGERERDSSREKMKVSRQSQLLRSVLVHVASAFICALVCSYSYWFPWLYCLTNHFVLIYLPKVWPVVFGPKYMFFVANVIVLVVIGDWREACAKSNSTHQDMYEEYVRRSRRPRRVLVYKKVEKKAIEPTKKSYAKTLVIKKKEKVEKKEEIAEEFHESKEEDIIQTDVTASKETVTMISVSNSEEKHEEMKGKLADHSINSAEKTIASHDHDDDAAAHFYHEDIKNARSADNGQNENVRKAKEIRSNDDDLNQRVEDFIARVNKRIWAEANN